MMLKGNVSPEVVSCATQHHLPAKQGYSAKLTRPSQQSPYNLHYVYFIDLLDRCIQHRGASLKTHARGINEKDLGTRSLLSGFLVFHRSFLCPFVAYQVLFFFATSLHGSYFLITAHVQNVARTHCINLHRSLIVA